MNRYVEVLGASSPTIGGARRAADIFAALAPPAAGPHKALVKTEPPHESVTEIAKDLAPGIGVAAAGAYAWKKHRVLGALLGHAVGSNAYKFYKGDKTHAWTQLAVEVVGVLGALKWKKHPVLGWGAGIVAGTLATSFVPGSASQDALSRFRKR